MRGPDACVIGLEDRSKPSKYALNWLSILKKFLTPDFLHVSLPTWRFTELAKSYLTIFNLTPWQLYQ